MVPQEFPFLKSSKQNKALLYFTLLHRIFKDFTRRTNRRICKGARWNPPHTHTHPLPTPSQSIWGLLYHLLEVQIFSSPGPLRYRYTIGTVDGSLFYV